MNMSLFHAKLVYVGVQFQIPNGYVPTKTKLELPRVWYIMSYHE